MGRKRKVLSVGTDDEQFRNLDREYQQNECGDPMVEALNALPADERSLFILYIMTGNNKTALAKKMGCSYPIIDQRIFYLQVKLKEIIEKKRKTEI